MNLATVFAILQLRLKTHCTDLLNILYFFQLDLFLEAETPFFTQR
jgi:hypothetical protein